MTPLPSSIQSPRQLGQGACWLPGNSVVCSPDMLPRHQRIRELGRTFSRAQHFQPLHFPNKEMEAQRSWVTCPRSHSCSEAQPSSISNGFPLVYQGCSRRTTDEKEALSMVPRRTRESKPVSKQEKDRDLECSCAISRSW